MVGKKSGQRIMEGANLLYGSTQTAVTAPSDFCTAAAWFCTAGTVGTFGPRAGEVSGRVLAWAT